MSDDGERAKARKKTAKAQLKLEKKRLKLDAERAVGVSSESVSTDTKSANTPSGESKNSPAERSASAAERQVRLQFYRVFIAVLMFLVGAATLLITLKPWQSNRGASSTSPELTTPENDSAAP